MATANPSRSQRNVCSIGLGLVLVLGVLGGVPASSTAAGPGTPVEPTSDGAVAVQEGNNTTDVTIPIVRAMEMAQNETNGTAVGAQLRRKGNLTNLERPTRVYEVDVLTANDTHFIVDVNATNGSVRTVQPADNETGFFEGLFGSDDEAIEQRPNLSAIRSAIEAVRLARNETDANQTITDVVLTTQNETLVYEIELVSGEGIRSTVVSANPDEGDILTTETGE